MKVCEALRESRSLSGKSQEYMALELEVARKTVQNWEKGVSEPTIGQAVRWFEVINISPIPYLIQVVHTGMHGISAADDISKIKKSLHQLVDEIPEEGVRQLMYLFYGDHGSSPRAVLNMVTAHLQTPMNSRVIHGHLILKSYEIAAKKGLLTSIEHVQPNQKLLQYAIDKGEEADINNANAYVLHSEQE